MNKVFEYRLRPNKLQREALMKVLIASRKLYNDALAEWKQHFEQTQKYLSLYDQDKRYNKQSYPDVPAVVTDQVMKRLHRALTRYFKGRKEGLSIGFPRFKAGKRWNSIEFRDGTNYLDGRYFRAGKQCGGKIRTVVHRPLAGKFCYGRILLRPSGWYLQCIVEVGNPPLSKNDMAVGLDMGITYLVADSEGNFVENPKYYRKSMKRLASAQRRLSTKTKGSKRRRKAVRQVARVHEKIRNQRKDVLHKVAREYVNQYQTVVVEDLKPANLVKNHCLALSISDSSWGLLHQFLESKAASAGRQVVAVPPHFTSQKCSSCGEYVEKSLSVRTHVCPYCGYIANRDTNAAINILSAWTRPSEGCHAA